MKKLIAALLAGALVFSLTACDRAGWKNETDTDREAVSQADDSVQVPDIAQDIYHGGSLPDGFSLADRKVIPLGTYFSEWNCTATFATYKETSDGAFILEYLFLGGDGGYDGLLDGLSREGYPAYNTDYGLFVDVSKDEIAADADAAVEIVSPACAPFQLLFEGETFTGIMDVPSVSETICTLKDGKIGSGHAGIPVLQENKLVGWVSCGDADGSAIFQMINSDTITG